MPKPNPGGRTREPWYLLALWVGVLAGIGVAIGGALHARPTWIMMGAGSAGVGVSLLFLRLVLVGYTGYERVVGLRIIRRDRGSPRLRRWLGVSAVVAVASIATLFALSPDADVTSLRGICVAGAAVSTFLLLLLLIARRFSVFGTTSIFGVVLGVAALVVVQSVATGFQHEFERRVLGVYAHINVTRPFGIPEYRRFEAWLKTLPGITGASPFVYYPMALAPYDASGKRHGDYELASVLVKGIHPQTADQVIDVVDHLSHGSGRAIPLSSLRSDLPLMPVPPDNNLPDVIEQTPDPRGPDWYEAASQAWRDRDRSSEPRTALGDDEWLDPPDETSVCTGDRCGDLADGAGGGRFDKSSMPTMFVGYTLAADLDLEEGDVVRLVDPGSTFDNTREPQFRYYVIAGVFQAGFQEYDSRLVYVDIKELQHFKYNDKDTVSGVDLRLEDPALAHEIGQRVSREIGDRYSVFEWQKLNENLFSSIETQKNIITIILSLVIFVASFNVLSALWTMTVRRTAEVAILMSMGGTGPQIARVFQVTGMTIGLAGSVAGVLYGLVLCWLVSVYGYNLDPEVYFIEELPVEVNITQIAWILGLSLGFCFVATIPPALRAARLHPVEGLRYE
jgi:lipoprotein-releasing system permease protein